MANSLPSPLVGLFEQHQPESRVQRVWQGIRSRREAKHQRHWVIQQPKWVVAACTLAIVGVIVTLFARPWRTQAQEHALIVPANIEAINSERQLDFGYGAIIRVAAGTKLDVLEQSERSVVLALRHGTTHFSIRPGGPRSYRIESGGVSVEVVGTQFDVERTSDAVKVNVQRGRVLVRGPGVLDAVQALDAGRSLVVSLAPVEAAVEPQVRDAATAVKAAAQSAAGKVSPSPGVKGESNPPGRDWRGAATRHEWNLAWQSLGADGLAREVARTDNVADLLALADVARLTGHPNDALKPLRQIVGGHPEDPRSAMAAFTMGRVLLDSLGNPVQAAFAFERAMSLKLPTSLAEDAQARLVEAHARSGAVVQARTAANTYRARYPAGRRLADVNHWSPPEGVRPSE